MSGMDHQRAQNLIGSMCQFYEGSEFYLKLQSWEKILVLKMLLENKVKTDNINTGTLSMISTLAKTL